MNNFVQPNEDVVELGDVRTETRGNSVIGPFDPQTGLRTFMPGIQTDD